MHKSIKAIAGISLSLILANSQALADQIVTSEVPVKTMITAYQGPMSLFQETHDVKFVAGTQTIALPNLPMSILPDSILLNMPKDVRVDSYAYAASNVTPYGLLAKLLGEKIKWATLNPITGQETIRKGKLISVTGGIVIEFPDGLTLDPPGRAVLDSLPDAELLGRGLRIHATAEAGKAPLSVDYLAGGLNWQASYVVMLQDEENAAAFDGQMSLNNMTGVDFSQANIRLVAGNINMQNSRPMMRGAEMAMAAAPMADGMSQVQANDTHIYNLDGRYDVDNETTQLIPFISSDDLKIRKKYVLVGYVRSNPEPSGDAGQFVTPEIRFSLKNDAASGLGKALPAGRVRVMAMQDGTPMLLGEDRIGHTPVGEVINLRTGRAFDVTAKRKQVTFKPGSDRNNFEAGYEIILKNTKATGVVVDVVEHLPGKWEVTSESMRHVKRDVATAIWAVSIPANGEVTLEYSMRTHR